MALFGPFHQGGPKAVIFDLDEAVLDRRRAWQYTLEQAVALGCRQRIDAGPLVEEYRLRPWRHVLSIVAEPGQRPRCEDLCVEMFERSALKRVLVHEGIGMALDALQGEGIEMGVISRARHALALKQIQSTGLDRFLAVLSASPGDAWEPAARVEQCLRFLQRQPGECAYISGVRRDLAAVSDLDLLVYEAAWSAPGPTGYCPIGAPSELAGILCAPASSLRPGSAR